MPNAATVPQQDRTRDMGVSASDFRPPFPFSSPEEMFAAAERWFGTAPFVGALENYRHDAGFVARKRDLEREQLIRNLELGWAADEPEPAPYAAELIAKVQALPVAEPFPGVAVPAQPTAAGAGLVVA